MTKTKTPQNGKRRIAVMHPIYLDTPMMLSFIATLEGGFSMLAEFTESQQSSKSTEAGGEGGAGTGEVVSMLGLKMDTAGRFTRSTATDSSAEQRFTREHTSASLFNRLYTQLDELNLITRADEIGTLASVEIGDIVEIRGVISENPIEIILRTMDRLLPLIAKTSVEAEESTPLNRQQRRALTADQREELDRQAAEVADNQENLGQLTEIVEFLREDLNESPIVDLRLHSDISAGLITADREFFSNSSSAMLVDGTFNVIGKVTGVTTDEGSETNIMRRGAIAGMKPVMKIFSQLEDEMSSVIDLPSTETTITGRCLQIIPLAIFI
ncbi:hypothetical protein IU453_00935 [Nocardia cyriacigeorgica]|uniref:DUF6414 family protein n=1 Tax=Nocardia cyriacigeorgica TaxID=135487 RepID=UPI00189348EF|nr:hypothetical protein [Nocardia cyriacigeorgica]MBF6315349.1 hypothetical protein [Nocardia cyriacigeorgica]MBF6530135.1 hypothetical protein [Nocardia cyriacigeorgica]